MIQLMLHASGVEEGNCFAFSILNCVTLIVLAIVTAHLFGGSIVPNKTAVANLQIYFER